jgi:hypothetical protein
MKKHDGSMRFEYKSQCDLDVKSKVERGMREERLTIAQRTWSQRPCHQIFRQSF